MDKVTEAAIEYLKRQARVSHPIGKMDKGGRWYPSEDEQRDCCSNIRGPTRSYPWSLMVHCRTVTHVCNLYKEVSGEKVRFMLSKKGLPLLIGSGDAWTDAYLEKKLNKE